MQAVTVRKLDHTGKLVWQYRGEVLARRNGSITLQAYFDRDDRMFHGMPLCKGDRFVETYFTNRWYNIYEIHAREDDHLRGWYCNVGKPAHIEGENLSYVDLALDLLVFPDGRQILLDEDEFEELPLEEDTRLKAREALAELMALVPYQDPTEGFRTETGRLP